MANVAARSSLGEHVGDGVMDKNGLKSAAQPHGAHVPKMMLHAGVQGLGVGQHSRRNIHRRGLNVVRQVRK